MGETGDWTCLHSWVGWCSQRVFPAFDARTPGEQLTYTCEIVPCRWCVLPALVRRVRGRGGTASTAVAVVTAADAAGTVRRVFAAEHADDAVQEIVRLVNARRAQQSPQQPQQPPVPPTSAATFFGFDHPWVQTLVAAKAGALGSSSSSHSTTAAAAPPPPVVHPMACCREGGVALWQSRLSDVRERARVFLAQEACATPAPPRLLTHKHSSSTSASSSSSSLTAPSASATATTESGGPGGPGTSAVECVDTSVAARFRQMRALEGVRLALRRSPIQGFGVFARVRLEPGTMLMEYRGQLIRQSVADIREERYGAARAGDYMFSMENGRIVDATRAGSGARFINHCCEPNCETRFVTVGGVRRIVVYAKRLILPGEELAYDYKFPLDDQNQIPCHCGAKRCRGRMN